MVTGGSVSVAKMGLYVDITPWTGFWLKWILRRRQVSDLTLYYVSDKFPFWLNVAPSDPPSLLLANILLFVVKCLISNNYSQNNRAGNADIANQYNQSIDLEDNIHSNLFFDKLQYLLNQSMGTGNMIISHNINNNDNSKFDPSSDANYQDSGYKIPNSRL